MKLSGKFVKIKILSVALLDLAFVSSVFAQSSPLTDVNQVLPIARKILEWVATLFWIAATIAIFYAAFLYLTAAGDEQKVDKAKRQLIYAVIAIAIGLLAYGIPALVSSVLSFK